MTEATIFNIITRRVLSDDKHHFPSDVAEDSKSLYSELLPALQAVATSGEMNYDATTSEVEDSHSKRLLLLCVVLCTLSRNLLLLMSDCAL